MGHGFHLYVSHNQMVVIHKMALLDAQPWRQPYLCLGRALGAAGLRMGWVHIYSIIAYDSNS